METRIWRYFDPILLLVMLALVMFGLAMIYSASFERSGSGIDPLVYRQATSAIIGLGLFLALSGIDYHVWSNLSIPLYGASCVALVVVLIVGRATHGSQRWIPVGPWQFQPSELIKIILVLLLSRYFAQNAENLRSPRVLATSFLIVGVPLGLVLLQPDVGTGSVYLAVWVALLFVAGAPLWYFGAAFAAAAALAPIAWVVMQPYQRGRILVFLNPESKPLDEGYNVIQAIISVGAGQFSGRGFLSGSQSQLHFLRVQYADFIFSVLAEELGFIGAFVLLGLFLLLFIRGMRAARLSRELYGRLVGCGIVTILAYQTIVNVGMNVGLLPVTGVPLPMISYGGSSLLTFLAALGILESIVMRHRKFGF